MNNRFQPAFLSALQAGNCQKKWTPVCYLTNYIGALHPEIEFHYVSGTDGLIYADVVRFTSVYGSHPPRPPVGLDGFGNMYIDYYNSIAPQTVLMQSFSLSAPLSSWLPVQINTGLSGTFYVPLSNAPAAFFYLKQQSPAG